MHPRELTMYHIFFQNGSTNVMSWCADCESTPFDEKSRLTRFLATCCSAHFILNKKPFNINADLACAAEHNQEAYEKTYLRQYRCAYNINNALGVETDKLLLRTLAQITKQYGRNQPAVCLEQWSLSNSDRMSFLTKHPLCTVTEMMRAAERCLFKTRS